MFEGELKKERKTKVLLMLEGEFKKERKGILLLFEGEMKKWKKKERKGILLMFVGVEQILASWQK